MKRPTTSSDDDFSFDFGGSEELFPLDFSGNDKENKPKGVKGYFKNVAKSVAHLGGKVAKDLYPEAFNFKDQFFEGSTDGEKVNINATLRNIKSEVKKYSKVGVDVLKEVKSDVKRGLLTGDFTEDPNAGLEAFFGSDGDMGFDFGSGFDDSDFGSTESDIKDSSGSTKKSKLSTQEAVVRSNYASAKANFSIGQKQVEATLGAAQSQIRHENLLFSQQMDIFQEQHRQKMAVMRNIAINLTKVVKQNNLSNRAQMEFSAKSLAFSQDLAAMVKEIRSAQWKLVTPKKIEGVNQTDFQKLVNGGFNLKYIKNSGNNMIRSGGLGMLFDMKEGIDMAMGMGDIMGGPTAMVKMMLGDTVRQGILNRILSGNTKNKLADFNLKMEGLPGAINRKLGDLTNMDPSRMEDWFDKSGFGKLLNKIPGGNKLSNLIKNQGFDFIKDKANLIHKDDSTVSSTGRYRMGDPNAVHPFDNKAHKALTEVIPGFLSKMEAGINHHDELYYDYGTDTEAEGFRTKKSMVLRYKEDQQAAYENLEGVREVRDLVNAHSKNNGINLSNEDTDTIIKNILKSGTTLGELRKSTESGNVSRLLDGLPVTEDEKEKYAKTIASALKDLDDPDKRTGDENKFVKFTQSMDKYQAALSGANLANEDRFSLYGSSAAFAEAVGNDQVDRDIKNNKAKLKKIQEKFKTETNPRKKENYKRQIENLTQVIRDLERSKAGRAGMVNSNISNFSINTEGHEGLEDYAIKDLDDDSTHGFVKNIYNLLLEGIDVYTHAGESEEHKKQIASRKSSLRNNYSKGVTEAKVTANEAAGYEEFDIERYYDDLNETDESRRTSDEYYARTNKMRLYQKTGEDYIPIPDSAPLDRNQTYYYKRADMNAIMAVKRRQETKRNNIMNDPSKGFFGKITNKIKKIPILNKIIPDLSKYGNGFDSVINTLTGAASAAVGSTFYGEEYANGNEDLNKIKTSVNEAKDFAKGKASELKTKVTESKIYNDIKDQGVKAKEFIKKKSKTVFDSRIAGLKIGKMTVAQHIESIQSKELIVKLEKANGTRAKIAVLREFGTEKSRGLAEALENELKKPGREILDDAKSGLTKGATLAGTTIVGAASAAFTGGKSIFDKVNSKIIGQKSSNGTYDESMSEKMSTSYNAKKDKIRGDSSEEQKEMAKEREQEKREIERNGFLGTIAAFFKKADKDGIDLSKDTLEEQKENFEDASANGTSKTTGFFTKLLKPILEKVPGGDKITSALKFTAGGGAVGMTKKGLGKVGKNLLKGDVKGAKNTLKATGKTLKKGFKLPGLGKSASKATANVAKGGAKVAKGGKMLGLAKKAVKAPGKLLKGYSNVMKGATKGVAAATQGVTKASGVIGGALKKLLTSGPIGKKLSQSGAGKLIGWITKGIVKAGAKVATKVTTFVASASSVVGLAVPITLAVKDFISGMKNCKDILKVGKGIEVKFGMRLACGLAQALDGFLIGIPSIIASFFGYDTLFNAIYDLVGSREEKAALERYKIYNTKRAQVLGIKDQVKLSLWENHNNGFDNTMRSIGHYLTLGLMDNNDEKDAKTLGFKTPAIYKYWKKHRYEPIMALYDDIANKYGGKKAVEAANDEKVNIQENENGEEVAVEEDENNQKIAEAIENQNKFRKEFLQAAINKVKELKVAWLTSECSEELFKKMSGESAEYSNNFQKAGKAVKDKLKKAGGAIADGAKKAWNNVTSMFGGGVKKAAKAISSKARVAKDWLVKNVGGGLKSYFGMYKKAGKAVVKGVKNTASYVFSKSKDFTEKVKKFAGSLTGKLKEILNKMFDLYNYSENTKKVMTNASDTIGKFFAKFTQTDSGITVRSVNGITDSELETPELGGDPAGESAARIGNDKIKDAIKTKSESIGNEKNGKNGSFGKNKGINYTSSSRSSRNGSTFKGESAAAEFVTKFSEEMTEKLSILDKMHEEQMRHDSVSEEFFVACLKMMSQIANNTKNSSMSSQIDQMVQMVSK